MLNFLLSAFLICPKPIPLPYRLKQVDSLYYIEKVNYHVMEPDTLYYGHNEFFTGTSYTPDQRFTLRLKDSCVLKTMFFKSYVDQKDWRTTK